MTNYPPSTATSPEISFDALTHTYYAAGRVVPGVTTILKPLHDWGSIPEYRLEVARSRGVAVHAAIDLYNQGILDEGSLEERIIPRFEAYKNFLRETGFVVTASELCVFDAQRWFAGTLDLTGTWRNNTWVVDIKTGEVPKSVGPQLAAYQWALPERPQRRLCVSLSDYGYKLRECEEATDIDIFFSCLNIWRFRYGSK